jgi:hypothetical protein
MSKPNSFFSNEFSVPKLPHDDRPIPVGDFDYEDEVDECPSCGKSLSEHTQRQRINCALKRLEGVTHH